MTPVVLGGALSNSYRYRSYVDFGTPYYQMGARYCAPGQGRFTQQAPLGSSVMEPNRYHYAGCNPANRVDPTGLFDWGCGMAVGDLAWSIASTAWEIGLSWVPGPQALASRIPDIVFGLYGAYQAVEDGVVTWEEGVDVGIDIFSILIGYTPFELYYLRLNATASPARR